MHHHCVWNGSCSIHIQIHGVQVSASCYAAHMHEICRLLTTHCVLPKKLID